MLYSALPAAADPEKVFDVRLVPVPRGADVQKSDPVLFCGVSQQLLGHRMDEFYFIKIKMMCHRETKHRQNTFLPCRRLN